MPTSSFYYFYAMITQGSDRKIIAGELVKLKLEGEILTDSVSLSIYSTDASVYSIKPAGIVLPRNREDIRKLVRFCQDKSIPLTTRGAGTSLAGQATGKGIIADLSRYMTRIVEFNPEKRQVTVEPGIILDDLNRFLQPHGLFFSPETSTANRCTIGGMVGNNACGLHSLVYGSTRDHLVSVKAILSDGTEALFGPTTNEEFYKKCELDSLEGLIYRNIRELLGNKRVKETITTNYPHPSIPRRNTGYCLDLMIDNQVFNNSSSKSFNFATMLAGSEGTLAVATEITLSLVPLPPPEKLLLCVHLKRRRDAFTANLTALRHSPSAVEMVDDRILQLTENLLSQRNNRFFIMGEPGAIVIVELNDHCPNNLKHRVEKLISDLKMEGHGYHFPIIEGADINRVWELRRAGLGILSNMKGAAGPVSLIEDSAVRPEDLADYMDDLMSLLSKYDKDAVMHAHIGSGELHIRPLLDLKNEEDIEIFYKIGYGAAQLIKKYKGSLSGEHGDGRVRSEFITMVLGEEVAQIINKIKEAWDPESIFNPGIIANPSPMKNSFRYQPGVPSKMIPTLFDFNETGGILGAAEKCNGSADCRKSQVSGGVMCPTFMATGDERFSTRARANLLRESLTISQMSTRWDNSDLYDILDQCISCKGCMAECPSSVDIAKLKAEFLQHWHDNHPIPLRTRVVANLPSINRIASLLPRTHNIMASGRLTGRIIKKTLGFAQERSLPLLGNRSLNSWIKRNGHLLNPPTPQSEVVLFIDEFTDYSDTETGIEAIRLLAALNYKIITVRHKPSGRTYISKGFLRKAAGIAAHNTEIFYRFAVRKIPIIGIEPSAILTFRDEYPQLLRGREKEKSEKVAEYTMVIDEFLSREFSEGRIKRDLFDKKERTILLHTHCQQKALYGSEPLKHILSIPAGNNVNEIASGCCGMAGSFGYEKEHYELSNKIGEMILFPEIRNASEEVIVVVPGTSCRQHIYEATGRESLHPASLLYRALKNKVLLRI